MSKGKIILIGAGLSGTLLALLLGREGYAVTVYEKRDAPQGPETDENKSINLGLSADTLALLVAMDCAEVVRHSVELKGRMLHFAGRPPTFQPCMAGGAAAEGVLVPKCGARAIPRAVLHAVFLAKARALPHVTFQFGCTLTHLQAEAPAVTCSTADGTRFTDQADVVIGADGAFSEVRRLLGQDLDLTEDLIAFPYGYQELPALPAGRLRPDAHHLWPRLGHIISALPNLDGTFRAVLFLPHEGTPGFDSLTTPEAVRAFFETHYPALLAAIPTLVDHFRAQPVGRLTSMCCWPWHAGRTVLIGDACHTVLPFSGRGANMAIEDCAHLIAQLRTHAPDWPAVFTHYADARKPVADGSTTLGLTLAPYIFTMLPLSDPAQPWL